VSLVWSILGTEGEFGLEYSRNCGLVLFGVFSELRVSLVWSFHGTEGDFGLE